MTKLTNLYNEAQKINLSLREKALMRAYIFEEAALPVQGYTVSQYRLFSLRFAPALAAVLIIVLGGGTAYAAQGALPGELLYTVKVSVNEPLRQALAVSTEAKAAFHTEVAQTRLEEAETLAAEGRLTASTSAKIETNLDAHLAHVEEITAKLEEEEPDIASQITAELDSSLSAHGFILARLGEESDDRETRELSNSLASRITSRVFARVGSGAADTLALKVAVPAEGFSSTTEDLSSSGEVMLMTTVGVTEDKDTEEANKRIAAQLKEKAQDQIDSAQETFDDLKDSLDATTTARVEAQFEALDGQMKEGAELYDMGDYATARATFGAALRDSTEFATYLKAEQRFNKKFLRSWVDDRFGSWFEVEIEQEAEVQGAQTDDDSNDKHGDEEGGEDKKDGKEKGHNDDELRSSVEINLGL
ncbi:MAG: DUF5667 domain-containing protein [Patescibacteria group bacterium]|nr:DUF5667 domain-containing protein [Patescibacteria group bacterium]